MIKVSDLNLEWSGQGSVHIQTNIQTYQQNRSFQNWALYYSIVGPVKSTYHDSTEYTKIKYSQINIRKMTIIVQIF